MKIYDFISKNFNEDSLILEIGIHHGEDTKKIYELTGSKIHAFEPDPRNIEFIEKNKIYEFCKFNPFAVSKDSGISNFFLSSGNPYSFSEKNGDWSLSSSLKNPKDHLEIHPWCKFEESVEVKTISIDEYVKS
jgi:FkbM family methyltransferase